MEKKLKSLMPSLKEKKRYIAYKQIDGKVDQNQLIQKINQTLGIFDSSEAGIQKILQNENGEGIIRVTNKYVDKTITSTMLIQEAIILPLTTTGIINKAKKILTR